MDEMRSVKWPRYIWIISLVGSLFTFIGLLFPAGYFSLMGEELYQWIWGLVYFHSTSFDITTLEFTTNVNILNISLSCSTAAFIGCITILVVSVLEKAHLENKGKTVLILSIITIIAAFMWMFLMEMETLNGTGISYWGVMHIGLGIIGPLVGSSLSLIAGILSISVEKRLMIREHRDIKGKSTSKQMKYKCVNCGYKTSKLVFQPEECPKCEGKVFKVL